MNHQLLSFSLLLLVTLTLLGVFALLASIFMHTIPVVYSIIAIPIVITIIILFLQNNKWFINYVNYKRQYYVDQKIYIIPFYTKKGRVISLVHPNYLFEKATYKGESKTSPDSILVITNLDKKVRRIPKTWVFSKFTLTLYLFNPYKLEDYVFTRK